MITAIAQFNGDNKGFEALEHYDREDGTQSSRRIGYLAFSQERKVDHWYEDKISNESFFVIEKQYHLRFRLEFIV